MLKTVGAIAEKHGITVVIEPLNKDETNLINTVPEAVRLAKAADCKSVKALVDFFHFSMENEPEDDIINSKDEIAHVHLARGTADRGVPNEDNLKDLANWAEMLKKIGFNNKLSIEAGCKDFEKEIKAVRSLLNVFDN